MLAEHPLIGYVRSWFVDRPSSRLRNCLRALQRRPDPTSCSGGRTASASAFG